MASYMEERRVLRGTGVDPAPRYYVPMGFFGTLGSVTRLIQSNLDISYDEVTHRYGYDRPHARYWFPPSEDSNDVPAELRYDPKSGRMPMRTSQLGYRHEQRRDFINRMAARCIVSEHGRGNTFRMDDIYTMPRAVSYPAEDPDGNSMYWDANQLIGHEDIDYASLRYHKYRSGYYAAFDILGVPQAEWAGWNAHCSSGRGGRGFIPILVWTYKDIARRFDAPFTPGTYNKLDWSLRMNKATKRGSETHYSGGATLDVVTEGWAIEYCRTYAQVRAAGVDPETVHDLHDWVTKDYSAETIALLTRAGVNLHRAEYMYQQGIKPRMMARVQSGEVPMEWALDAARAREGVTR